MQSHKVTGGGGAQIHAVETGNPQGRPIFYIHGMSQCWLAWSRQLNSDLAQDHRLVAMDMRGHGLSDKPEQGYDDAKLWADDVNAVIETLGLDNPVLCGWSYGPLVILDYVRHFGEDHVGGFHFVGGVTKLGSEDAVAVLTPEFLGLLAGFFSTDVRESIRSLDRLVEVLFPPGTGNRGPVSDVGVQHFRFPMRAPGLLSRSLNNDDILPKIRKPVLITRGSADALVKPSVGRSA